MWLLYVSDIYLNTLMTIKPRFITHLIVIAAGHLTYECRNFIRVDPTKDVHLDISSTSSEESDKEDKISISSTSSLTSSSEEERRKRRQQESMCGGIVLCTCMYVSEGEQ